MNNNNADDNNNNTMNLIDKAKNRMLEILDFQPYKDFAEIFFGDKSSAFVL